MEQDQEILDSARVAVCSRSFSSDSLLRSNLESRYSNVKYNETGGLLVGQDLVEFASNCTKVIVGLETIDEALLTQLPELKVISKYGVGLDAIDLQALRRFGISLGWTGGLNKRAVSELVLSQVIAVLRKTVKSREALYNGVWQQDRGRQLSDKTVGLIGCGNIGKDVVRLLQPFDCEILVYDKVSYHKFYAEFDVTAVSLDELLARSDVVSLHVPLDQSTKNILGCEQLKKLKNGAIVVNTARGGLLDENCLIELLSSGKLGGAVLDVFELEPPKNLNSLKLDNLLITSHIGGSSNEAIRAMGLAAIDGLDANSIP